MDRLKDKKIELSGPEKRFESEQVITFHDPDGLELELVSHKVQELCSNVYEEQKFTVQVLRDIIKSNTY
jgi:hypothetical protein